MFYALLTALLMLLAPTAFGASGSGVTYSGASVGSSGGGGGPPVANCTDGVDCRCDTLLATYGSSVVVFCEDFEHPNLPNTQDSRNEWDNLYDHDGGNVVDTCIVDNVEGLQFRAGFYGDPDAAAEGKECLGHASEADCIISGETDCVYDGTYSLAQIMNPGKNQGITGVADFANGRETTFGVTMLMKYSSNSASYLPPSTANGPAFKPNEFGDSLSPLFGYGGYASNPPADVPNNFPFVGGLLTPPGYCEDGVTECFVSGQCAVSCTAFSPNYPTMSLGAANASQYGMYYAPSTGVYQWNTTYSAGEWGCFQWHGADIGTAATTIRIWFDGTKIMEGEFNTTDLLGADETGIGKFSWNNYFNGPGAGTGYPGPTQAARYEDNIVVFVSSDPLPCSEVGWVAP